MFDTLPSFSQVPLASGGIDLRLLHYEVLPPRSSKARAGDWPCPSCAVNNFANRHVCFKCTAPKPLDQRAAAGDGDGDTSNAGSFTTTMTADKTAAPAAYAAPRTNTRSKSTTSAAPEVLMSAPEPSPQIWSSSPWSEAAPVMAREEEEEAITEAPSEAAAALASSVGSLTPEAVASLTVPKLKVALKARRLPVSGLKRDLAERLLANL